jgi:glycosyltransferase involved in cell wall biosynthesis
MEAMACACPVVLSDIAPHREFVAPSEALWFGTEDVDALRDRLAQSLADPAAAQGRAGCALASIRRFSVDAMVRAYDAVYQGVLGHA